MLLLEVLWSSEKSNEGYYLKPVDGKFVKLKKCSSFNFLLLLDPTYFQRRCAEVICNGKMIGKIGVVHPNVLAKFEITNPCACVEINIEPFI